MKPQRRFEGLDATQPPGPKRLSGHFWGNAGVTAARKARKVPNHRMVGGAWTACSAKCGAEPY
jgi:hypothetical protein